MDKNSSRARRHIENIYDFTDKVSCVNDFIDNTLNRTLTMFTYKGLPDTIPETELEFILQVDGGGIVTETSKGLMALWGGFAPPYDGYYRPTKIIITNPYIPQADNKTYTFGVDCVRIKNDPLCKGLMPIIRKYGALLTETELSILLADYNHRAMFMITGNTDTENQSANAFINSIIEGKPKAVMEEIFSNGIKTQPYANSSGNSITQLIELEQYIRAMFFNEIGLNANYNMKRERLSESEAGLNEDALRPLIDAMLEERQKFCDEINKMYGTDITVEFNSTWAKYNEEPETVEETVDEPETVEEEKGEENGTEDDTRNDTDTTD